MVHLGGKRVWALAEEVVRFIDHSLQPGAKTLETGCGLSTVVFAMRSVEHTCIVPSRKQVDLILAYAEKRNMNFDHVHFIIDFSQNVLPGLQRQDLDMVLIDGGHGFPIPAIDWFYTAPMLKVGGIVIIDDVALWTGLELKRFLAEEPSWRHVRNFSRSVAFEKIDEQHGTDFYAQSYIIRKSRWPRFKSNLRHSLRLISQGKLGEFVRKARKQLH